MKPVKIKLFWLLACLFFISKGLTAQCLTPGPFVTTNYLACQVRVMIILEDCNTLVTTTHSTNISGNSGTTMVMIPNTGCYNVDVALIEVGSTQINGSAPGLTNQYNPSTGSCLPGLSLTNDSTGDLNCTSFTLSGTIGTCDINP